MKGLKGIREGIENREIYKAKFNACFEEINNYRGRYRVFMGGAGSGKSFNIAQDYLLKLADPLLEGANLLLIRKTKNSHKNSCFPQMSSAGKNLFGKDWERLFEVRQDPMRIRCRTTGNEAVFLGIKDEQARERLKSIQASQGKLCWIWCEEASELTKEDFELLDDRLRGELRKGLFYQITLSFNPVRAKHWLKKRFFDQRDPDAMCSISTYRDNCYIDEDFAKRMEKRKEHDPEGYRIYALGEWGQSDGLIFTHFQAREFEREMNAFDAMAFGTDFGFNHPHATLLLGIKDGRLYVCDELVLRGRDTGEIEREMREKFSRESRKSLTMWCDSAEPDRIKTLRSFGWRARGAKKEAGSVLAQIDWIKQRELWIHPECRHCLEEIQNWSWKKDWSSGEYLDEPKNFRDDAMAALRYGIEGWRRNKRGISFE